LGLAGRGNFFSKLEMVSQGGLLVDITAHLLLEGGFLKVVGGWESGPIESFETFFVLSLSLLLGGTVPRCSCL
jgi:hypothetical protein